MPVTNVGIGHDTYISIAKQNQEDKFNFMLNGLRLTDEREEAECAAQRWTPKGRRQAEDPMDEDSQGGTKCMGRTFNRIS